MNGSPRSLIAATLAAAALVIAGCGGGDDDSDETTISETPASGVSLSKDEYIEQGDAICAEVNAAVSTTESGATDEADRLGQTADLYEGMLARLRGLGSPEDDPGGLNDFYAAGESLVQSAKDAELAAQRGDDSSLSEAAVEDDLANFQAEAADYGFDECADESTIVIPGVPTDPDAPVTSEPAPAEPVVPTEPVVPAPAPAPAPAPEPAPAPPPPPTGGSGTGGGGTGGGTGGSGGSGGVGPG